MTAYLILTVGSLMFWSLYQMAPNGLQLFAINNVDLFIGSGGRSSRSGSRTSTPSASSSAGRSWRRFYPAAGARVEAGHPAAVRGVLAAHGAGVSHSAAGHPVGGRGRQERVCLALRELCAAKHRRAADLADRIRDDRQARAAAVPGRDDGQLDAGDRFGVAFCGRLSRE